MELDGHPLINSCTILLFCPLFNAMSHYPLTPLHRTAAMRARRYARKRICRHPRTAQRADPRASSKCPATAVKFGCATSQPQTVIYNTIIFGGCTNTERSTPPPAGAAITIRACHSTTITIHPRRIREQAPDGQLVAVRPWQLTFADKPLSR